MRGVEDRPWLRKINTVAPMGELRQDRTSGGWVVVAPERGVRPHEAGGRDAGDEGLPPFDPHCPFCPGNEAQLPGILAETADGEPPGWRVRVVPNKYPVVRHPVSSAPRVAGRHVTMAAHGAHEVVIESPRHDATPASFSDAQMSGLVSAYHRRVADLFGRPGIEAVILFRNRGIPAGASLHHPHSQIVGLGMTPPRQRMLSAWMRRYWRRTGRCVTCDELDAECADGARVVEEARSFVTLVPFAATVPFETWIVPRRHQTCFADMRDDEQADFGCALRNALARLESACGDPPYNFAVESFGRPGEAAPHAHWRLRIAPNLVAWGGFELGAGLPINPSSPEDDAARLRRAAIRKDRSDGDAREVSAGAPRARNRSSARGSGRAGRRSRRSAADERT